MLPGLAPLLALVEAGQAPVAGSRRRSRWTDSSRKSRFMAGAGALDVEAVVEDAVEDGLADEVVVVGLGGDAGRAGAEGLAAGAAGGVLGVEDAKPEATAVGEGADVAFEAAFAAAAAAAGGAGVARGSAADGDDLLARLGLWHMACVPGGRR